MSLVAEDLRVLSIWAEHGIPFDRSTVEHASHLVRKLLDSNRELHQIIDGLTGTPSTDSNETATDGPAAH